MQDTKNNIYLFFGADSKVGVTMITSCVCESLAHQEIDVCCMHLDGKYGDDYTRDMLMLSNSSYGLDNLRLKLKSKIINLGDVKSICALSQEHLYHFYGIKDILKKYYYEPDEIEILINECQKTFDVVVIDAGSNIHLGMTIAALLSSQNRFLVTTPQSLSKSRFAQISDVLNNLGIYFEYAILNKFVRHDELVKFDLSEYDQVGELLSIISYLEYGWQCEKEGISLMKFNNKNFIKGIEDITKKIMMILGVEWESKNSMISSRFNFDLKICDLIHIRRKT